jgi:O-acetyl-ADP-ribose deacetylase (regulator of RNase III)
MPTTFVEGDLFQTANLRAFAHGCNCAGAMGKGIGVEFRARFPRMYDAYKARCAAGLFVPGGVFTWREGDLTVFNLGTQKTWRSKALLPAIKTSVAKMIEEAEATGLSDVGLPRIGAGLGGLEWATVRELLAELGAKTRVNLLVFEKHLPAALLNR